MEGYSYRFNPVRYLPICLLLLVVPGRGLAQVVLTPASVSSSSFLKTSTTSYDPGKAADDNPFTWWTPAAPNSNGSNSWLQLDFEQPVRVLQIDIWNGSHHPNYPSYGNLWKKNLRLRQAKLEFSDGTTEEIVLEDVDAVQQISLQQAHTTTYVRLIPKSVFPSEKWQDLCISEFAAVGLVDPTEETNEGTPTVEPEDLIGVYVNATDPCEASFAYIVRDPEDPNRILYTRNYLMDAEQGELVSGTYSPEEGYTFRLKPAYGEGETYEASLGPEWTNAGKDRANELDPRNEDRYNVATAVVEETFFSSFLSGEWRDAAGRRVVFEPGVMYVDDTGYAIAFERWNLATSCGTFQFREESIVAAEWVGIKFQGENAFTLHELKCADDNPDCWLEEAVLMELTRN